MTHVLPSYFERKYRTDADPWAVSTSDYEQARSAAIAATLPRTRYRSGFEAGCGIGQVLEVLAPRCSRLLGIDASATAAARARAALAHCGDVEVRTGELPAAWPPGPFDLIVISELAYYFSPTGVDELARLSRQSLTGDGQLCLVNWRGSSDDMLSTAVEVRSIFQHHIPHLVATKATPGYFIDVLEK